ncbi:hypothetical protein A9Q76_07535 [Arcobacter sp. 31_11_sub10_T18]|nr:hypothetical protein A9Q76_07535 [Arcobacter sp. 31_11_sub10_T18]
MTEIKKNLQEIVSVRMLPEVEAYIEDLHKLLVNNTASEDDMNVIKDMESFMVELQNILEAIETDMISDVQAQEVYENMMDLIEESEAV